MVRIESQRLHIDPASRAPFRTWANPCAPADAVVILRTRS